MKIIRLLAILLVTAFVSCGHDHEPEPTPEPEPKPEEVLPPPEPQPEVSRTILVYIVANNTLGDGSIQGVRYDYQDIDEMLKGAKVGYLNGGRLLVYHSAANGSTTMKEVTSNGIVELKNYGDESPLTVSTMRGVLDDMRQLAPAEEYGLVLWSHSTGWINQGREPEEPQEPEEPEGEEGDQENLNNASDTDESGSRSYIGWDLPICYSWGIDDKEEMSIPALGRALNGQNLMFIYFDCCFMGNVESLYQIRNAANYVIASATEVPLGGMAYDRNLANLFKYYINYKDIAKNTYDYYNAFDDWWRSISMSVYDMSQMNSLVSSAADVFAANPGASVDRSEISSYSGSDTYPNRFFDLKQYINSLTADENAVARFNQTFDRFVVYTDHTPYMWWDGASEINSSVVPLDGTNGLSCYIMNGENDDKGSRYKYKELDWWSDAVSKAF